MPDNFFPPMVSQFLHAIWEDLGARLSGALSVPFTFLAVYTNNSYTRRIYALLAVSGFLASTYRVWASERKSVVQMQSDLDDEIAKRGRPEITLELKSDNKKTFHVCLMNYTEEPALNLSIADIPFGVGVLRFGPIPTIVSSGFSPTLQCNYVDQGEDAKTDDIIQKLIFDGKPMARFSDILMLAVRYTDTDGKSEWVSYAEFAYDFKEWRFVVNKQWIEKVRKASPTG